MSSLAHVLAQCTMTAADALVRNLPDQAVQCLACAHRCTITPGHAGLCRVRSNRGGKLQVPAKYIAGLQIDPIEKKPFFHAFPGANALSFGMLGCCFHCPWCQNWVSSQTLRDGRAIAAPERTSPAAMVALATRNQIPVIVSTYNEPLITSDWAVDIFSHAIDAGITCGYVSNGHATPEVIDFLKPYVKLFKVDLKSFNPDTYKTVGGKLDAVLDTIAYLHQHDFWIELVTLIIPGHNDSNDELRQIASFIAKLSPDIPWHCTAFHPDYTLTDPPRTPPETLQRAYHIGRDAGLNYVYSGNLPGQVGSTENTVCPQCNATLIERQGFTVNANHLKTSHCPNCNHPIPGVWQAP